MLAKAPPNACCALATYCAKRSNFALWQAQSGELCKVCTRPLPSLPHLSRVESRGDPFAPHTIRFRGKEKKKKNKPDERRFLFVRLIGAPLLITAASIPSAVSTYSRVPVTTHSTLPSPPRRHQQRYQCSLHTLRLTGSQHGFRRYDRGPEL